ncbi:DUF736 domain-containing protein [Mesorhizobium sp. M3A.F.Ca.ET.201.01.1.1]|uniref:DUF736 domain-containing protein n=1 Tax=Mesorhizobium sp. M3A.F.Ca.ET.201.01.1.1 TaxID=2563946 RepID=UPI0010936A84|nr:DUF736 domain-containing protein [Mesorhizobium sp. M3A.F.Ca.ET.201.01.1.1]TGS71819.1 DUF736 domain-containing protein [Mesorhizobium sp. M3A.F.Ca.ET.201.01.1.1]
MPQIGEFTRNEAGYSGHMPTLSLDLDVTIVAAEVRDAGNAPDYRVHAGVVDGPTIGSGWTRSGEKAGEFVSLQINDPTFAQPIRCNLFQNGEDKTSWSLQWSRRRDHAEKD